MTSLGVMQATPVSACEQMVVAPRTRKRRGATDTKSPAVFAAGNGHDKESVHEIVAAVAAAEVAMPAAMKRSRRRFQRATIGFPIDATEGHVKKWEFVEEEDRRGDVIRRRVRLLDEDGFPTTGPTGWVETDRWLSEPTVIKFPEGTSLPAAIRTASRREQHRYPDQCVGGFRLLYSVRSNSSQKQEWFPASDQEKRQAFFASLPEASPEVKEALAAPPPEPAPAPDQWFRVELTQPMFDKGAWEEFPDGWCAKLVPQPEPDYGAADPDWTYVQLPYRFNVWYEDEEGQPSSRCKTDKAKAGGGRVGCGMWIPRWLLVPISASEAAEIYDVLAAQVAAEAN